MPRKKPRTRPRNEFRGAEVQALEHDQGPPEFYTEYERADEQRQRAIVQYIGGRMKVDPDYISTQNALVREASVVPVTSLTWESSCCSASRAKPSPTCARPLQSAEDIFLAIGGVAGESDAYRLSLGKFITGSASRPKGASCSTIISPPSSASSPICWRFPKGCTVWDPCPKHHTLAEEAYNNTSVSEEKQEAAHVRAVDHKDLDDEIVWLNRCNTSEPRSRPGSRWRWDRRPSRRAR